MLRYFCVILFCRFATFHRPRVCLMNIYWQMAPKVQNFLKKLWVQQQDCWSGNWRWSLVDDTCGIPRFDHPVNTDALFWSKQKLSQSFHLWYRHPENKIFVTCWWPDTCKQGSTELTARSLIYMYINLQQLTSFIDWSIAFLIIDFHWLNTTIEFFLCLLPLW